MKFGTSHTCSVDLHAVSSNAPKKLCDRYCTGFFTPLEPGVYYCDLTRHQGGGSANPAVTPAITTSVLFETTFFVRKQMFLDSERTILDSASLNLKVDFTEFHSHTQNVKLHEIW